MQKIKKEKVLVVDNDRGILESFDALLGDEYNLIVAENGYQALELIRSERPSLIFLDVKMPGLDGFDLLHEMKKERSITKVILISATDIESYRFIGKGFGIVDYLQKPFDIEEARVAAARALYSGS